MTVIITSQRNQIRQTVRQARQALSEEQQVLASANLLTRLINHPRIMQAKHVSVTLAYDGEIDLSLFIEWCWQQGKQVYLPMVHPTLKGHLFFLEYQANTEMIINRYGIKEPKLATLFNNSPEQLSNLAEHPEIFPADKLDIVFTPLVAFDTQGNRIGMGGGYYDRLLTPWFTNRSGPYPIGLAHDCQCVTQLPIEAWDVPLPEIITPQQHLYFSDK
ncbi:5-formyltetrahydrofolate cyclo-ligase [Psychromonas sp. 14N.309.X.WAT.B.A12]|uniref:5-formyltetrahydrofolate cyclo-ligase n=1 Tax=unclassified Psychromonas TaxID=2614957 RepID=UPI0025AF9148|nr:5-formyltetrahydrofolate cyclo-ligase [Psychromonas sp. 14N.309.X.WAT.B.A12]MDN2662666.1 5-formyltetrahydrofolate cyclo-ligase [Psychromonas sp. 14N.309.X.WAT.B.A12]